MAYSKTVWNNNTPPDISAENLNKMEQGIADAQFPDGGSTGQILAKTNDGTGWIDAPTSAEWGNIEGQLSEQTDLYSELESKITMPSGGTTGQVLTKTASGQAWDDVDGLPSGGTAGQVLTKNSSTDGDASWQNASGGGNVDTVNGISPDANKNVQTATDLTEAAYEALPSTKESDNVDYYLTDADSTVATAEDIPYDNTTSGMTATNVQGAVDELNNGLTYSTSEKRIGTWTDGKPIYLKVVTGLNFGNTTSTWTATGANIANVDTLVKCEAMNLRDNIQPSMGFRYMNGGISYWAPNSWGSTDTLYVYYTKTTD